eukprot:g8242.t1
MTEFHQLQGRFDLAPIDGKSGERKFPFERDEDPVSLATRYKMMNDKVLERQTRESRKLRNKLNKFRTTKKEIHRVLTDNGVIEPTFSRPGVTEKAIYDETIIGRRKEPPKHLNEQEQKDFENLKIEYENNKKAIEDLHSRLHKAVQGKENLKPRGKDEAHDPSLHHGWSVINLGTKVQVFCNVGKSLGHTKTNFVRSGKVVYFDAKSNDEAIRLCRQFGGTNDVHESFKELKKQSDLLERLHAKGIELQGVLNKATERRQLDAQIVEEERLYDQMNEKCCVGKYNSRRKLRKYDNTYGILYEDNELEFGVTRSRIAIITSASMEMSLEHIRKRKEEEERLCKFKPPHKSKELKKVPLTNPETGEIKRDIDGNPIYVVAPSNLARSMEKEELKRQKRLQKSNEIIRKKKEDRIMAKKQAEEREKSRQMAEQARKRRKKEKDFKDSQKKHEKRREDVRKKLQALGIDPNLSKEERAAKRKVIEDAKLKKKQDKVKAIRKKAEKRMEDEELRKEAEHKKRYDKEKAERDHKKNMDKAMRERTERRAKNESGMAKNREDEKMKLQARLHADRMELKESSIQAYHTELIGNIKAATNHLARSKNKLDTLMKDIEEGKSAVATTFDFTSQKEDIEMEAKDLIGRKKAVGLINSKICKLQPLMENLKSAMEKFRRVNQFFFYVNDMRATMEDGHPDYKVEEISKLLLDTWGRLDKSWDRAETKHLMKIFQVTHVEDIPSKKLYWDPTGQYPLEKENMNLYTTSKETLMKCKKKIDNHNEDIYTTAKAKKAVANKWKPPMLRKRDRFLEKAFNLLDVNGDEEITKEEFINGKQNLQIYKILKQSVCLQSLIDPSELHYDDDFKDMDTSGDGKVRWDELKSFVETKNKNAAIALTDLVFDELDSDNNGILELDRTIHLITTSNNELRNKFKQNTVGQHLLTPSNRKSAIMALEEEADSELLDDERQISRQGFLKLLEIVLQHADNDYIVYRKDENGESKVYSIANNIKDWDKMKKIAYVQFKHISTKEKDLKNFYLIVESIIDCIKKKKLLNMNITQTDMLLMTAKADNAVVSGAKGGSWIHRLIHEEVSYK